MSYTNPELQQWHDERLTEIKDAERVANNHIAAIRFRSDKLEEPFRTEINSVLVAIENHRDYIERRFAMLEYGIGQATSKIGQCS